MYDLYDPEQKYVNATILGNCDNIFFFEARQLEWTPVF